MTFRRCLCPCRNSKISSAARGMLTFSRPIPNTGIGTWRPSPAYRRILAADLRLKGMSVIVSNANHGARRLYERTGYSEIARRPMVKEDWVNEGTEWVLLTKSLA